MGFLERAGSWRARNQGNAPRPRATGGIFRRLLRWALRLLLIWVIAIVGLSIIYWVIPPISTLMIGDWVIGKSVQRTYVSLDNISPQLARAVITSEDAAFCAHSGVDWSMLGTVVQTALEDGASRGASTIPMQTAKNLFMLSNRSYMRKGLEIPVALYLDTIWSKRRMIEIYLNVAEWGNGIYGAEAASQFYFRKSARNLTQREAALLATTLPNPIKRNPARASQLQTLLAQRLMQRMEAEGPVDSCVR